MNRTFQMTDATPRKWSTKLVMVDAPYYKAFVRAIQVMDVFDRLSLSVVLAQFRPGEIYTLVNSKLLALRDNGFVEHVSMQTTSGKMYHSYVYKKEDFLQNPELAGVVPFHDDTRVEQVMRKSSEWGAFMDMWAAFLQK